MGQPPQHMMPGGPQHNMPMYFQNGMPRAFSPPLTPPSCAQFTNEHHRKPRFPPSSDATIPS